MIVKNAMIAEFEMIAISHACEIFCFKNSFLSIFYPAKEILTFSEYL